MSHQTSWMDRPAAAQQTILKTLLTLQVGDWIYNRDHTTKHTIHLGFMGSSAFRCTGRFAESQNLVCHRAAEAVHTLQHAQSVWTDGS